MNKTTNNTKIDNVRSGYTTGQWSIQENSANRNLRVIDNAKRIVADCYSFSEAIPQLEAEANAKLIAAAPELAPVVAVPVVIQTDIPGDGSMTSDSPCTGPLSKIKGPQVQVTFTNTTDGDVSLYLYSYKTVFGCGIGDVSIAPFESVTTTIPKACYDFYGWITGSKDSTPAGYGCLNFDQTVTVRQSDVIFKDQ